MPPAAARGQRTGCPAGIAGVRPDLPAPRRWSRGTIRVRKGDLCSAKPMAVAPTASAATLNCVTVASSASVTLRRVNNRSPERSAAGAAMVVADSAFTASAAGSPASSGGVSAPALPPPLSPPHAAVQAMTMISKNRQKLFMMQYRPGSQPLGRSSARWYPAVPRDGRGFAEVFAGQVFLASPVGASLALNQGDG